MPNYWEDWSGYSVGDDPVVDGPAGWTRRWHTGAAAPETEIIDISADSPPTGYTEALKLTETTDTRAFLSFDAVDADGDLDQDIAIAALMRITGGWVTTGLSFGGPAARGSGDFSSETGCGGLLGSDTSGGQNNCKISEYNNASFAASSSAEGSDAWDSAEWVWVVLEVGADDAATVTVYPENDPGGTPLTSQSRAGMPNPSGGWVGFFTFSMSAVTAIDVAALEVATNGDALAYAAPSGDTTAPVLSSPTDVADGTTAGDGSVDTDEGNGTLYWVVTQSATSPSVAQVQAGQDHTGSAADDDGSQSVSGTGTQNVAASGLSASTTYYFHFQHQDAAANDSTVSSADGFTTDAVDSTAPVLTSPTATASGTTTADGSVSVDESGGLLDAVVTESATTPSVAQIQAGQDHTGAAAVATDLNNAISGTGVQSVSFTGLTQGTTYYAHYAADDAVGNDATPVSSAAFVPGAETVGLADDFDSAIGTIGTITDEFTLTPDVTITPFDAGDEVTGWLNVYVRVGGVNGKTPTFNLSFSAFRDLGNIPAGDGWGMVWRYVDDATDPGDGRPRDWNEFDNNSGDPAHTFSNSSAFTSDDVEIAVKPRWRYLDTQRAIAYVATSGYASELASADAFGGTTHVFNTVTLTSGQDNAVTATTLNQYGIALDDTSSQPAGGADKLNEIIILGQHASEDQGSYAGWERILFYMEGVGTLADWFRQHVRLFIYDANPAGRYYGAERYTQEQASDEDSNRAWNGTNSEQINAVKSAITTDVSRVDLFNDFHGGYFLNGNGLAAAYGIYQDSTVEFQFRDRFNTISAETMADISGTPVAGWAQHYATNTLNAQLALTVELPIAGPGGYPDMESLYGQFTEDCVEALQEQVAAGEILLFGTTVSAGVHQIGVTANPAAVSLGTSLSPGTEQIEVTTNPATVNLGSAIGAAVQQITVTPNAAEVSLGTALQVGVQQIAVETFAAQIGSGIAISAGVQQIILTPHQADVSLATQVAAALQQIAVTPYGANIQFGAGISAQAAQIAVEAFQSGVTLGISLSGSLHEISVEALAASIGLGKQVDAVAQQIELTPHGATLSLGTALSPAAQQIEVTTFRATIDAGVAAITVPGLEFTLPEGRMHYTLPVSRIHFTFEDED